MVAWHCVNDVEKNMPSSRVHCRVEARKRREVGHRPTLSTSDSLRPVLSMTHGVVFYIARDVRSTVLHHQ